MSDMWIVNNTEPAAKNAIDNIDKKWGYPNAGKNAHSGKPDPSAQQTITWAEARQRATDGQWVFPCPDDAHMPPGNPKLEPYDPAWFPPPEAP